MFKIGDFSKLSMLSIRMLRHYDGLGLLTPEKTDASTGYRYYAAHQLVTANRIKALSAMGFGLNEIKEILQEHDYGGCLKRRYEQMLEEQEKMKKQILMVESAMRQAERKDYMQFDVSIKDFKAKKVASLRRVIAKYEDEGTLWKDLYPVLEAQKVQLAQPPYCAAVFFDEGFKEAEVDVEIQAAVTGDYSDMDGVVFKTIAPVKCATVILKGDYSQIAAACEQVGKWIEDNAYAMCGPMFNIYHVSPGCEANPENWVTEICFPVKKH